MDQTFLQLISLIVSLTSQVQQLQQKVAELERPKPEIQS